VNAAEHLAAGEQYIDAADQIPLDDFGHGRQDALTFALVHLLAAIAVELGVPPVTAAPGGQ